MENRNLLAPKYVVHPGYVRSKNDGDRHYISFAKLCYLYNVNPKEAVIFEEKKQYPDTMVHLHPLYDGNYQLWDRNQEHQEFRRLSKLNKLLKLATTAIDESSCGCKTRLCADDCSHLQFKAHKYLLGRSMSYKTITPEIDQIIKQYAAELYADMKGDPEYDLQSVQEQEEEIRSLFQNGGISESFLRFAIQ